MSGGNLVRVTLGGDYEIKSIDIADEAKKETQETINDLIIAAYNNAKEKPEKICRRVIQSYRWLKSAARF